MRTLVGILLSLIILGCASRPSSNQDTLDNLDVENIAKSFDASASPSVAKPVAPAAAFRWQSMFKGPPTSKERPLLQQSIQQLADASTVPELLKRGQNESALGLLSAAEATYRTALRKDTKNIRALLDLATILQRQKRIPAALDVLAEAKMLLTAQERPETEKIFKYRYTLAMTYLGSGDRAKAHDILSDLIGKDPTFLPGYAALAFSYLQDGKDTVAKFIVEQAMDRGGDHAALYNILGILHERQGRTPAAKDFYNRSLGMNEFFAPALVNRGNLYVSRGELSMAETDFKKALDSEPSNTDAMIGLGVVFRQTGRFKLAKEILERALDLDADNPLARFNLAILTRENLKDEGLALRYFTEVMQSTKANQSLRGLAKSAVDEIRSL